VKQSTEEIISLIFRELTPEEIHRVYATLGGYCGPIETGDRGLELGMDPNNHHEFATIVSGFGNDSDRFLATAYYLFLNSVESFKTRTISKTLADSAGIELRSSSVTATRLEGDKLIEREDLNEHCHKVWRLSGLGRARGKILIDSVQRKIVAFKA